MDPTESPQAAPPPRAVKPTAGHARFVRVTAAGAAVSGAVLLSLELAELTVGRAPLDALGLLDAGWLLGGVPDLVFGLSYGVGMLAWLYRAFTVAHATGAAPLTASPGWAVGAYFVPLANLYLPYRNMAQLWRATAPEDAGPSAKPRLVALWWFCFVAGVILDQTVPREVRAQGWDAATTWRDPVSSALAIGTAVCAFVLVRDLQTRLEARRAQAGV